MVDGTYGTKRMERAEEVLLRTGLMMEKADEPTR